MSVYSWDAADYARHSCQQFKWAQELLAKLALGGWEDLLDIGCGHGRISALVARKLPRGSVLGIDRSADMISYASRELAGASHANLSFRQLDAAALDFHRRFDVVFSNAALHWVSDHPSLLAGVGRSLRDSGRVLFEMGGQGNAAEVVRTFDELMDGGEWKPYFQNFSFPFSFHSPALYGTWLRQAGLEPDRVELVSKDMQHQGREGLAGWIRTTWLPWVERVPAALRSRFIDEFVASYTARHPADGNGVVHVDMVRLEVEARRAAPAGARR